MRAYLTTIGERTTNICKEQLIRCGFDVVIFDKVEPWIDKYKRFLDIANEDCLRIDADIILCKNAKKYIENEIYYHNDLRCTDGWLFGFTLFDFYRNDLYFGSPVFYTKQALDIMKKNIDRVSELRPEVSMSRLPEITSHYIVCHKVIGMHGFFQNKDAVDRAMENKIKRGQMDLYDFELVNKILNI